MLISDKKKGDIIRLSHSSKKTQDTFDRRRERVVTVKVKVLSIKNKKVTIGIEAPEGVLIDHEKDLTIT